ncbi:ankyrin repeat-containing domain protein [Mycena capillaripes]|nr:ankyrin repeat-containing domain protein [Mycena capillaripes]
MSKERSLPGSLDELDGLELKHDSKDYFEELPPELILLLPPSLSIASLNALVSTCRRLHEILQSELDSRITTELAHDLLLWAAASNPHIITKLLSPPYSIHPTEGYDDPDETPLHVAAEAGNKEIALLLLEAGADPEAMMGKEAYAPLHLAVMNNDIEMAELLLDHGAEIEATYGNKYQGYSENALHYASREGHLEMVKLLVKHGAIVDVWNAEYGTALGYAVRGQKFDVVNFLLEKGAAATADTPIFDFIIVHGMVSWERVVANPLFIAMNLRYSSSFDFSTQKLEGLTPPKWEGLPLSDETRKLMALLLAHGASKDSTMEIISRHLDVLVWEAKCNSEEEYLEVIVAMFKEAEDAIPDVLRFFKQVVDIANEGAHWMRAESVNGANNGAHWMREVDSENAGAHWMRSESVNAANQGGHWMRDVDSENAHWLRGVSN